MTIKTTVSVALKDSAPRGYAICIGKGVLDEAADLIQTRLDVRRCVIVTDSNVGPLYLARLEKALTEGGHSVLKTFVIPAGEASKNFTQLGALLDSILALGIDRKTLVIALGGGVVGDLAGVAASLLLRGVDCVQIPTSLLAQVDSSVGGKTGIDTAYGKNTIGTFYQPQLVLADVGALSTLPSRELRAGYAEVVKYGLIADRSFFYWCEDNGRRVFALDEDALVHAVAYSCEAKARIVAEDEHEAGPRAFLNLGHTFGHALETANGFGAGLIHGEAVAVGTLMAFRLATEMGLCSRQDNNDVHSHFASLGLPLTPPPGTYDIDRLIALMATDKKAENGKITLVLPHGIGKAVVHRDVDADVLRRLWKDVLGL